jgi:hypothetical protein
MPLKQQYYKLPEQHRKFTELIALPKLGMAFRWENFINWHSGNLHLIPKTSGSKLAVVKQKEQV